MKAAVLVSQNSALEIYDIEVPKLDVGQVMVRVEYSGICGKQIDETNFATYTVTPSVYSTPPWA